MGAGQESRGWGPTRGGCLRPPQPCRPQGEEKGQACGVDTVQAGGTEPRPALSFLQSSHTLLRRCRLQSHLHISLETS